MSKPTIAAILEVIQLHRPTPSMAILPATRAWPRLLVYTGAIWLVIALLGCLAIGYGHARPTENPAVVLGLAWCDRVPCYQNLVPGQTRWIDNVAKIGHSYRNSSRPDQPLLFPSSDHNWLGAIFLPLSPDTNLTADDIVLIYGPPCRVDIDVYGIWGKATFHYPQLDAQMDIAEYRLDLNAHVHLVILRNPTSYTPKPESEPCEIADASSSVNKRRSWRGFTSFQHYFSP